LISQDLVDERFLPGEGFGSTAGRLIVLFSFNRDDLWILCCAAIYVLPGI
jgi:hypothetical protein